MTGGSCVKTCQWKAGSTGHFFLSVLDCDSDMTRYFEFLLWHPLQDGLEPGCEPNKHLPCFTFYITVTEVKAISLCFLQICLHIPLLLGSMLLVLVFLWTFTFQHGFQIYRKILSAIVQSLTTTGINEEEMLLVHIVGIPYAEELCVRIQLLGWHEDPGSLCVLCEFQVVYPLPMFSYDL